ncbi:MAG TPA: ABC transporter transmembrane domain-containing protein, partial [Myxococcota bacterium]|nr:ABC transporter transmembrane domain-containing protein [Myxococcota bacterium]
MKPLGRLLRYLKPELLGLLWAYAHMLALALTTAFLAFLSGPALNFVFSGELRDIVRTHAGEVRQLWRALPEAWLERVEHLEPRSTIWVVPCLLIGTAVLKGLAQTGQFYLMGRTSQRVLQALRLDAFSALLRQSPAFFARRTHGDLVSRLTHDTGLVEQAFFYGAGPLLRDTLSILVLLGFCFSTDPVLSLITFVTVPLAVVPLARFTKWLKRVSKGGQVAQGQINAVCYETLAGVRVVQACQAEARERQRLAQAGAAYYAEMRLSYFIRAVRTPTMETLGSVALAGLLALLGYQVQRKGADPAH